jgi:N-acetylglutamate synthase-like GNAT family acetyltransferase
MTQTLTELTAAEFDDLRASLSAAKLPTDDIDHPGRTFFRFGASPNEMGYGGLEVHGPEALLRSVVIAPAHRSRGQGAALVCALEAEAKQRGVARLWLLTTTAPDFFAKLGFTKIERALAPAAIAATHEFASLCPSTAVCMCKSLASSI